MQSITVTFLFVTIADRVSAISFASNASSLRSGVKNPQQTSYGTSKCPCVGIDNLKGYYATQEDFVHVQRTAETGASCEAWDKAKHPKCHGDLGDAEWCKQSWCYVDPCNCELDVLPKMSKAGVEYQGGPAYWSYKTCGGTDFYSTEHSPDACIMQKTAGDCSKNSKCAWDGKQCGGKEAVESCSKLAAKDVSVYGQEDCRCIGLSGRDTGKAFMFVNKKDLVGYSANVGSTCAAWEEHSHPECTKEGTKPSWCSAKWCFVDPCKCKAAQPPRRVMGSNKGMRFQGKTAYWSYGTCGSEDTWSSEQPGEYCVTQKSKGACSKLEHCAWNGKDCLGKALVDICQKQAETGILGMEDPLLSGVRRQASLVAVTLMLGAWVSA